MEVLRRVASTVLAAGICLAGYWSARLALADLFDREGTPDAVRRASRLAPWDSEIPARLSAWQEAIDRNAYDSRSLIRLGLGQEEKGDFESAERSLLRAAEVDRLYLPRWTLANYYFRRRDWDSFWKWAAAAAGMSPEAPLALYRLCGEAEPDAGVVFDRVVAGRKKLLAGFLYWVEARNDRGALRAALERSVGVAGPEERDALVACMGRMLDLGASDDAVRFWSRLAERRVLPFERLDPATGASLTNGDFRQPPKGEAFNWATAGCAGVAIRWQGAGLKMEFSGNQPEGCDLVFQDAPVLAGRRYRLRWRYRTEGIPDGSGPVWLAGDSVTSEPLSARDWTEASMDFTTPPQARLIRLMLVYRRIPGTTRIGGTLWLSNVWLELDART